MRINSRKIQKMLLNAFLKPFCTQEAPRCIGINATHKTIYLISEKQTKVFSILYSL
jgi:hypothetical protein